MRLVILTLVLGLVVLTVGAELLVRSASKLAIAAGISPLVVGLTVVAIGTSAPELVVSVQSTWRGQPDVAMGNVVGSNIFNVLLILGISALIIPLRVSQQLIRFEVPLMIGLSLLVWGFAWDGRLGRIDGAVLVTGMVGYLAWAVWKSRKEQAAVNAEDETEYGSTPEQSTGGLVVNVVLLVVGLGLLVLGARWFVDAAIMLARQLGMSELVIGLTIVAAGTSLPEVATSIVAAIRGERDIAVGNVVGSNLFNIMGVLGLSGLVSAPGITVSDTALQLDIPVMVAVAFACLPIFFTGHVIARWEGALFLAYYGAYTAYLVTAATVPEFNRTLAFVMLAFVIPLTAITLVVGVVRYARRQTAPSSESEGSGI